MTMAMVVMRVVVREGFVVGLVRGVIVVAMSGVRIVAVVVMTAAVKFYRRTLD